jgi:hypothetical protein
VKITLNLIAADVFSEKEAKSSAKQMVERFKQENPGESMYSSIELLQ